MSDYNRKDHLYKKAKEEGYRSRAAYKLVELDQKYSLLKSGAKVLELGCWPGGWLQIIAEKVGPTGIAAGIDLAKIEDMPELPQIKFVHGDARDEENIQALAALAPEGYDLIVSDMSPKLTGIKEADQAGTVACAELAAWIAERLLKKGQSLVIKVFKGNETEIFVRTLRTKFSKITRNELDSTRTTSNEYYVVAVNKK